MEGVQSISHCKSSILIVGDGDGELAQLVIARGFVSLGTGVRILVPAITFSCATIHFQAMYNLQRHQRPDPLIVIPHLYGVGG